MFRTVLLTAFVLLLSYGICISQTKTIETRTSVDSVKRGDTTVTRSVIISTSEDITPLTSILMVNPLKFLLFYNISYLHKITADMAVGAGIQTPTLPGISGVGFNAEIRFYPSRKAPRGFYVAPNISMNFIDTEDGDKISSPMSIGGLIGWQWFPGDQFAMGLGIGLDYYTNLRSGDVVDEYDGTAPALRFDIGYGW